MAKISNTTVYPTIIPTVNDYVVLTDVNDNNATKTSKLSDFQAFFGISTLQVTLGAAEILALNTNPKILLTANAGEYILPISSVMKYTYANVAYTFAGQLELRMGAGTSNAIASWPASSLFNGVNNVVAWPLEPASSYEYGNAAGGDSLTLGATGVNPTGGDGGTLTINVQYRIVKF